MKRALPYIIGLIFLILLGALLVSGSKNKPLKLDERITLKKEDKIPYGMAVARTLLSKSFPKAIISFNKKEPSLWNSINQYGSNQAVIIVSDFFSADEYELERIFDFAENGNTVFIITRGFNYETKSKCGFDYFLPDEWLP